MQDRLSTELNPQDKMEQKNGSQNSAQLTDFPDEILLTINDHLSSVKDKAHVASVNRRFYGLFQPEIGKEAANEAANYAILPKEKNVETLKALLKACPALLLHPVTVNNRHDMAIKGTIYQIALHEGDNQLIDDVIKPAFERLYSLEMMEEQRKTWLPDGWIKAEEKTCESACNAIDAVFTAFKNASNPNDVTEISEYPFTITINNEEVNRALDAFREAIDALYKPTDKVIMSGCDPFIRLIERVIDRYKENYNALGGDNSPHNHALRRAVYHYCQLRAPINFIQAFAHGIDYIVEHEEKLIRSFEYRNWEGHFIYPLDSDFKDRLGTEYYAVGFPCGVSDDRGGEWPSLVKTFCQLKTASALQSVWSVTPNLER